VEPVEEEEGDAMLLYLRIMYDIMLYVVNFKHGDGAKL
jgi:hypothetical protein